MRWHKEEIYKPMILGADQCTCHGGACRGYVICLQQNFK